MVGASHSTHRCSLLVYGSLMHPEELTALGVGQPSATPVTVSGYRREFSQEPSWRVGSGVDRGVLTVRADDGGSINAVLIQQVETTLLHRLDHRERGYVRRMISANRVGPFDSQTLPPQCADVFIYVGKRALSNLSLRPHADYLKRCLAGAAAWGEHFRDAFLQTTFVAGSPLCVIDA